jgi:hypothetical protein
MAATPSPPPEKAEQMTEKVLLQLKEFKVIITKDAVLFDLARSPAELTYKEWRVLKTFVDMLFSEMRGRA